MGLFQKSVLKKYLGDLDDKAVRDAYVRFKAFFFDKERQEIIIQSKEEQFQHGFLDALFGKVLGYTLHPEPGYNLSTEFKNQTGAKKADGAILVDGKALGVIELKSTRTKDLESVRQQAFDYKSNHEGCVYIITSNFEKLRFYINTSVEFEEFDLFTLSEDSFRLLYLCLAKDSLLSNTPLKIKDDSLLQEESITKKLYADYSLFKRELYRDMVKRNMQNPELKELAEKSIKKTLFKKSQKLLDRFLFIFFAEDRGLLPPNAISKILDEWKKLGDLDAYTPLYGRYKKHFDYLDKGYKGKDYEIFAYNGGLFEPDAILDSLTIDDDLLFRHSSKLTRYNFETDVDVNILGHIFEHSLNEIESINAEIEGAEFDKQKTKRKKDGIFYTPKYITKYIVDNTIGRLCEEKRKEHGIVEEEYLKGRKGRKKETIKALDEKLKAYRKWLLEITICDPACGSGAFLNQALDFLISEHHAIDELNAKLYGDSLVFPNVENHILENNIYGVDLNEESIEIAKLSLWLRTAQKGRKLTTLSSNIKCGNSLIDDPAVAGDKAFDWEDEFPEVFEKSGFDVVIGNPPYGASLLEQHKKCLLERYDCFKGNVDIYTAFIQSAFQVLKQNGFWAYINPVSWQSGENYFNVRDYIKNNGELIIALKLPYDVFKDAYVDTGIYIFKKGLKTDYFSNVYDFPTKRGYSGDLISSIQFQQLPNKYWQKLDSLKIILNPSFYELLPKVVKGTMPLGDISKSIRGILANKEDISDVISTNDKRYFTGDLYRYTYSNNFKGVNYGEHLREKPKDYSFFQGERILIRRLINRRFRVMASYAEEEFVNKKDLYNLKMTNQDYELKYVLAIINSKLISFLKTKGSTTATKDDFSQLTLSDIRQIPIKPNSTEGQLEFCRAVDILLKNNTSSNKLSSKFLSFVLKDISNGKATNKLKSWHQLDFGEFITELNKAIKKAGGEKLSKKDEIEWMELFEDYKEQAVELQSEIDKTDKEIDRMVYDLYELTEEEIALVEGNS